MDLTETEKVAVLLVAIGPKRAQRVLDRLSTDELVLIVDAMKRLGNIDPDTRRQVLEEVNDILKGMAKQGPSGADVEPPALPEAAEPGVDLFARLGPYLPESIDPSRIDWDGAGFHFDDPPADRWRRRGSGPADGPEEDAS